MIVVVMMMNCGGGDGVATICNMVLDVSADTSKQAELVLPPTIAIVEGACTLLFLRLLLLPA